MATKIIKFHDNNTTYVPVTLAKAVQFTYNTDKAMSVQEAIEQVAGSALSISYSVTSNATAIATHVGYNDIDFSYTSGTGVKISGVHTAKTKILKGEGLTYIKESGNNIIIGTTATNNTGTVTSITLTQGDGITVNDSGTAITTSGTRTITHATPTNATSGEKLAGTGKYFSGLTTDKFGHLTAYSTADLPTFTDTNTTVLTNGTTDVTADHKSSQKITLTGGTNKFTVKQGSSQFDVSITPSISNNVTGNGAWTKASYLTATNAASGNVIKQSTLAIDDVATKEYVNDKLTGLIDFKGNWPTTTPSSIEKYDAWRIQTASNNWNNTGHKVEVGDIVLALTDNPGTTGTNWTVIQNNIDVSGLVKTISGSGDDEVSITPTSATGPDANGNVALTVSHTTHNIGDVTASEKNVTGTTGQQKVITSITVNSFGHVTGYTAANIYSTDNNTHKLSYNIVGAATGMTNSAQSTNGNVNLRHIEGIDGSFTATSTHKITGASGVSVTSDASGNITITGPGTKDNNYSQIAINAQATSTTAEAAGGTAVTLAPASSADKLSIESVNKWVQIKGTSGEANADKIQIAHDVLWTGTPSSTQTLYKFTYDNAGHVTNVTAVSADKVIGSVTSNYKIVEGNEVDDLNAGFLSTLGLSGTTGNDIATGNQTTNNYYHS